MPNGQDVNLYKLQCISLGQDATKTFSPEKWTILPSNEVKVLVVTIDKVFRFYKHISNICCKPARLINILPKLHSVLDQESRMPIYTGTWYSLLLIIPQ